MAFPPYTLVSFSIQAQRPAIRAVATSIHTRSRQAAPSVSLAARTAAPTVGLGASSFAGTPLFFTDVPAAVDVLGNVDVAGGKQPPRCIAGKRKSAGTSARREVHGFSRKTSAGAGNPPESGPEKLKPPEKAPGEKKCGGGRVRADLGLRALADEWRPLLSSTKDLKNDAQAGLITACVSVPLSLAIAVGSGLPPEVGLVTAVVGSFVAAAAGGTPLAVSGPAAAIVATCAACAAEFGPAGVALVAAACGLLQVLSGALSLGAAARRVPVPVVAGFTSGIGLTVLLQQLPAALSLPRPPGSHPPEVLAHLLANLPAADPASLALASATLALIFALPRLELPVLSRLPSTLVAVAAASAAASALALDVPRLGAIPSSLPAPGLPDISFLAPSDLPALAGYALAIFGIASVESLLSSAAVDKLSRGRSRRHDPDQELIGQGLANAAAALFGGMPVSSVVVRSSLNIQSGAVTRRAGVLQSAALLAAVCALGPAMAEIPVPVLAGVLLSVALRMLSPHEIREIWRAHRPEALPWLLTAALVAGADVIVGVAAGVAAAVALAAAGGRGAPLAVETRLGVEFASLFPAPAAAGTPLPTTTNSAASVREAVAAARGPEAEGEGEGGRATPGPGTPALKPADLCDVVRLEGAATFASGRPWRACSRSSPPPSGARRRGRRRRRAASSRPALFDLSALAALDITGAELIIDAVGTLIEQGKPAPTRSRECSSTPPSSSSSRASAPAAAAAAAALCERYNGAESSIEELCDLVNKAFCREIELVQKHGGEIVSFLGGARAPLSLLPPAPAIRRRLTRTGGGRPLGAAAAEMARRAAQAVSCAIEVQELFSALRLGEGMGLRLRIAIAAGPYREYFCGIGERGVQEAAGGGGEAAAAQRRAAWAGAGRGGAGGRSERGRWTGRETSPASSSTSRARSSGADGVLHHERGDPGGGGGAGAIAPGQVAVCDSVFAFLPRAALAAGGAPSPSSPPPPTRPPPPPTRRTPGPPVPVPRRHLLRRRGPLAAAGGSLRGGDVTTGLAASLAAGAGAGGAGRGGGGDGSMPVRVASFRDLAGAASAGRGGGGRRRQQARRLDLRLDLRQRRAPRRRGSLGAPPAKRGARTLSLPLGGGAEARRGSNASLFGLDSAASEKGAVVLDAAARAAFETYVAVMGWRPADASRGGAVAPLRPHQHQPHRRPFNIETPAPSPVPFDDEARRRWWRDGGGAAGALLLYVPYAVRARVEQLERHGAAIDIARYISEFRAVSVMFVSLAALDTAFGVVQHTVQTLQAVLYAHQGSLRQVVLDDKGLVLIGVFGLWPVAHEDDPVRCTACALDVAEAMRSQRLKSSIGVSTGLVYSTFVGSPTRCEYSVFGTVVNKAARLMAMADGGILADEATAAAAAQRVLMVPAGEAVLKGIPEPVKLFQPRACGRPRGGAARTPMGATRRSAAASPAAAPPVWPSPMLAGLSGKPPPPASPAPLGGAGGGSNKKAERSRPRSAGADGGARRRAAAPRLMGGGRGWEDGAASARSGRSVGSHVSVAGGGGAHSSLVLLEGESGMGKSALLRDFRSAAKQRGAAVAASVSRSHHRRQPFNGTSPPSLGNLAIAALAAPPRPRPRSSP
eukprot:tig00021119_g18430.t1